MFLTSEDISKLTGLTQSAAQARWLRSRGYKYEMNGLGRPVVAMAEVLRKLVGGRPRTEMPDFGAVNGTP